MVVQKPNRLSKVLALTLIGGGALLGACGGPSAYYRDGGEVDLECRDEPEDCEGEIGGECQDDFDCEDGACCKDKNCDQGMCTYVCDNDADCPDVMACEHGYCFFECSEDADCGPGQSCEHGKSICEYEGHK